MSGSSVKQSAAGGRAALECKRTGPEQKLTGTWVLSSRHEGEEEVCELLKFPHIGLLVCLELQCLKDAALQYTGASLACSYCLLEVDGS